jgi:hypothetical protein
METRNWKMETGKWRLETGKWKLEIGVKQPLANGEALLVARL